MPTDSALELLKSYNELLAESEPLFHADASEKNEWYTQRRKISERYDALRARPDELETTGDLLKRAMRFADRFSEHGFHYGIELDHLKDLRAEVKALDEVESEEELVHDGQAKQDERCQVRRSDGAQCLHKVHTGDRHLCHEGGKLGRDFTTPSASDSPAPADSSLEDVVGLLCEVVRWIDQSAFRDSKMSDVDVAPLKRCAEQYMQRRAERAERRKP